MATRPRRPQLSLLYLACLSGSRTMLRSILTTELNIGIMSSLDPLSPTSPRKELHRTPAPITDTLLKYIVSESTSLTLHDGNPLKWSTMLHYAIETGHDMLLKAALEKDADVEMLDCYGCTALHIAVWKDNALATRMLLDAGANVGALSKWGRTPLVDARRRYASTRARKQRDESGIPASVSAEVIWMLLEKENGSYLDVEERPLLHLAVRYEHVSLVRKLVSEGVDVNSRDCYGRSALHAAAKKVNMRLVVLLLEAGAEIGAVDNFERRPVDLVPGDEKVEAELIKGLLTVGMVGGR